MARPGDSGATADAPTRTSVLGLNHVVLWVSDAEASANFYENALGLVRVNEMPGGIFMRAPGSQSDHDLALFTTPRGASPDDRAVGMYHMAWEVPTLRALSERRKALWDLGCLVGASDHGVTKSLYAHDPDGIEFEVMWEVPVALVPADTELVTERLDLDAEMERYGADTRSSTR